MSAAAGSEHHAPARPDRDERIAVIVTTYQRLEQLVACLDGIEAQSHPADEVLVITQEDPDSYGYVGQRALGWPALRAVNVPRSRSIGAYNAGLLAATAPLVAYIDDDAVPAEDWLERIGATFAQDDRIAAVGGRDLVFVDGVPVEAPRHQGRATLLSTRGLVVGRLTWAGRLIGNHHLGAGPPRDVDILKGVNMAFRRAAVPHGFDERLRGPGAVVHAELSICLPIRAGGYRIVYDPAIVVLHHPAPRPAGDHRHSLDTEAVFNAAHNAGLQIVDNVSRPRRFAFAIRSLLIGSSEAPGAAVLMRDLARRKPSAPARFWAARRGLAASRRTAARPRNSPPAGHHDTGDRPVGTLVHKTLKR